MKKLFLFTLVLILISIKPTLAHTLEANEGMSVVMHIDSNDDPIAGEQAHVYFDIHNKNNDFTISNCVCLFVVEKNGEVINSSSLEFDRNLSENRGTTNYTFPETGTYTLRLLGKPINEANFGMFELKYDLLVSRSTNQQPLVSGNSDANISALALLLVSACIAFLINRKINK